LAWLSYGGKSVQRIALSLWLLLFGELFLEGFSSVFISLLYSDGLQTEAVLDWQLMLGGDGDLCALFHCVPVLVESLVVLVLVQVVYDLFTCLLILIQNMTRVELFLKLWVDSLLLLNVKVFLITDLKGLGKAHLIARLINFDRFAQGLFEVEESCVGSVDIVVVDSFVIDFMFKLRFFEVLERKLVENATIRSDSHLRGSVALIICLLLLDHCFVSVIKNSTIYFICQDKAEFAAKSHFI
jgi:hypothetical protein